MKSAYDFRDLRVDGYVNVNEYAAIKHQLHACETLFGDRNAEVLILGQDAAHAKRMREIIVSKGEGAKGFRHDPEVRTNKNLQKCLNDYLTQQHPKAAWSADDCGIFYANAIWLLKDTDRRFDAMTNIKSAMKVCAPVFDATIDGLRELKIIIPLGKIPYIFLRSLDTSLPKPWREQVDRNAALNFDYRGRRFLVTPVLHPSPLSGGKDINALKGSFQKALQKIKG